MIVIRGWPDLDIVAGFEEAAGGGDPRDINAPRNAPALDPEAHLDKVYFHTSFDYYRLAASNLAITVNHGTLAGVAGNQNGPPDTPLIFLNNVTITRVGQIAVATHVLLTHNLGFVPRYFLAYNDMFLPHGTPIQREDANRVRFVSGYATTTVIGLKEVAFSSASTLSAVSVNYGVVVFDQPAPAPDVPLFTNIGGVRLGRGMIDSAKPVLRVAMGGDDPFGIFLGPNTFYGNGGLRQFTPDGTGYDTGSYAGGGSAPAAIDVSL